MSQMMAMLGDVFRQIRQSRNLNQTDVATQLKISQSQVSLIENGDVEFPDATISQMILYFRNLTADRRIISKAKAADDDQGRQ